ncbi:MAG: hypothetical protein LBN23_00610 [Paludibacter sp.]|jgi:hypothetical protein|nr:hypothetical protein [Paludibacter sp.]
MQGIKEYSEKLFVDFRLSERVPLLRRGYTSSLLSENGFAVFFVTGKTCLNIFRQGAAIVGTS